MTTQINQENLAQRAKELFDQANELNKKREYQQAL